MNGDQSGMARPEILVLAFSRIATDPRVLRQVAALRPRYRVSTCGVGPAPDGIEDHVEIPAGVLNRLDGRLLTLRQYSRAYWTQAAVAWCRTHLPTGRYAAVLANDLMTVPLALALEPTAGVHTDLHEYFPRLHEEDARWRRRIAPFYRWLLRRYVSASRSVTTVSEGLARGYRDEFGIRSSVVKNATSYAALEPTPVATPLRFVHSGACLRNRDLHVLVAAFNEARVDATLDLFLTPNDPAYLSELRDQAQGHRNIRFHAPVPYSRLITTLNAHDVGIHILPPVNFNHRWALPNKMFDFIQARLGILCSPNEGMRELVETHGLGIVADGFEPEAVARAIRRLTPENVRAYKDAAHRNAEALSGEREAQGWVTAFEQLLGERP